MYCLVSFLVQVHTYIETTLLVIFVYKNSISRVNNSKQELTVGGVWEGIIDGWIDVDFVVSEDGA